jgi:hypothetical protein
MADIVNQHAPFNASDGALKALNESRAQCRRRQEAGLLSARVSKSRLADSRVG